MAAELKLQSADNSDLPTQRDNAHVERTVQFRVLASDPLHVAAAESAQERVIVQFVQRCAFLSHSGTAGRLQVECPSRHPNAERTTSRQVQHCSSRSECGCTDYFESEKQKSGQLS